MNRNYSFAMNVILKIMEVFYEDHSHMTGTSLQYKPEDDDSCTITP